MNQHTIIGITGRKRSGKDTMADFINNYLKEGDENTNVLVTRFAEPLKLMLHTLLQYQGVPEAVALEVIEGNYKEIPTPWFNGHSPRHAMQTLGTEWARELLGGDFWINIIRNRLNALPEPFVILMPDVRFENEAMFIKELDGIILQVERQAANDSGDQHVSETGLSPLLVDHVVQNNGTLTQFYDNIEDALEPHFMDWGLHSLAS